ncbi:MAG: hypothetical protein NWR72_20200 [Bacteroidia bacterium]|nr:hypothetical protein [Bacteroidia bacterium]
MKRWMIGIIALLLISPEGLTQRELGRHWFKEMAEIPRLDPYDMLDPTGYMVFPAYDPVVKLSSGDLVYSWRPEFAGMTRRRLTRFNLFMEEVWDTEFRIDQDEQIFYHYEKTDTLVILSALLDPRRKSHQVIARFFEPDSGQMLRQELVEEFQGGSESPLFFVTSESEDVFLFFQLRREEGKRRVMYYTDYLNSRGEMGFRAMRYDQIHFRSTHRDLSTMYAGVIPMEDHKKEQLLDVSIDTQSNLYLSSYFRPDRLEVSFYQPASQTMTNLNFFEFPKAEELRYLYDTGFPPYIFEPGHAYLPMADRIEKGPEKGTKAFELLHFDFEKEQVSVINHVDVHSSLLVAVEKSREDINNRRLKVFDQYVIRDVKRLPNGKTWMVTQYFSHDNFRGMSSGSQEVYRNMEQEVAELVIFTFDTLGDPEQAIIIPTSQYIRNVRDRMNQYADLNYDLDRGELRILLREDSGEKYNGPCRIYLRRVNLETGNVSPREIVYDPDRRTHHAPYAFVEWINADIVQILSYEGDDERLYGVTVNMALPPLTQEEQTELRSRR